MNGQAAVNGRGEKSTEEALRDSGIDIIGRVPWGTHFCQFYDVGEDLLDLLVPYFKAGLENNEFCMWVTAEPVGVDRVKQALKKAIPDVNRYLESGQLEIIPHDEWYLEGGVFELQRVLDGWVERLEAALAKGYDGLRLTGNTCWLETKDWRSFTDYEEAVDRVIGRYRMMALCTYRSDLCGVSEVADVISNHQFALLKRQGRWEIIESAERRRAREELHSQNERVQAQNQEIQSQYEELQAQNEELQALNLSLVEAQTALSESEQRYRAIGELIPYGVWMCDSDGNNIYMSDCFLEMTGLTPQECRDWGWVDLLPPEERERTSAAWKAFAEKGGLWKNEHRIRGKDGEYRTVLSRGVSLYDDEGRITTFVGSHLDISERREMEKERERLLEELRVQNERIQAQNEELQAQNEEMGAQRQELLQHKVEIERANTRLAALNEVAKIVNRSLDLEDVLSAGLNKALEVTDLDGGAIRLFDESSGLLSIRVHQGYPEGLVKLVKDVHPGEGFGGRVFQSGEPAIFDHLENAELAVPGVCGFGIVAQASVPLKLGNEVLGVMNLVSWKKHEFADREITLLSRIGDILATAVKNAKLYGDAREQELRAKTITMSSGDGIFVVDGTQRVSDINPALRALAGYEPIDLLGKTCKYLINARHPDGSSLCDTTCPFLNPHQERWEPLEALITTKDGRDLWVEVTYGPMRDENGRLVGVVHNVRDVTARKEFDRLKDEFLSVAAHELKTPLTSLKGYAQATLRRIQGVENREAETRALKVIVSQTDRMADLVNDLLEVSRIQGGRLELRMDKLDLRGPAREVVEQLQITTDEHRLNLSLDGEVRVVGDYARIQQVLFNLIHNAIKYSPGGGDVEIRVRSENGRARVSVKDSGVGIPKEKQALLFDRFYRAHAGNAAFGGLGLGLHISREIVKNLGGEMWVQSEEGQGSTFYFTLPLA